MSHEDSPNATAFAGSRQIATGPLAAVAASAKQVVDANQTVSVLVFDDETGRVIDLDWRGTVDEVLERLTPPTAKAGPGRPRLGVVSREISLLPRHWEWLATQSGGASVTLRKLVDEARKTSAGRDRLRRVQDATYRFMNAMAGDLPDYEEALRAFYARDWPAFAARMATWPVDLRAHALKLAAPLVSP